MLNYYSDYGEFGQVHDVPIINYNNFFYYILKTNNL